MTRPTVTEVLDAGKTLAESLGLVGSVDVHLEAERAIGFVGKPGGDDWEIEIMIRRCEADDD